MDVHARIVPTNVAVIGAGAAGLAAARTLTQHGVDALLLEARTRVGGRAYTLRTPDGMFPIELGAEFIHGTSKVMAALVREAGLRTMESDGASDVWETAERVLERVDVHGPDRSVDAFLKSVDTDGAQYARMLIEGFDAAITSDASIIAVAKEWRSGANDVQAWPLDGYGRLIEYLAHFVSDRILLDTRVEEIAWSPGEVKIRAMRYGEALEIRAKRAIITVPAGVLRDRMRFTPPLPPEKQRALDAIAMGPVLKVVLHFRSVFWDGGFLQAPPGSPFPTIWSRMRKHTPILVAWAGGDAVQRLNEKFPDPIHAALDTCERVFPSVDIRGQLEAAYLHDWQTDPYAGGAYSYLRVGGGDARQVLGMPLSGTVFIAGEATSGVYAGTVAGAVESGIAAAEVLLAENRRQSDKV